MAAAERVQAAQAYALLAIAVRLKPGVIRVAVDPEVRTGSTQVLDDKEIKRRYTCDRAYRGI